MFRDICLMRPKLVNGGTPVCGHPMDDVREWSRQPYRVDAKIPCLLCGHSHVLQNRVGNNDKSRSIHGQRMVGESKDTAKR